MGVTGNDLKVTNAAVHPGYQAKDRQNIDVHVQA